MFTVKHSTVVFADIEGSSAIMQRDEVEGLALLQQFKNVITRFNAKCNGKLLHIWGDGCLAIFETADDALEFSILAQCEFVRSSWPRRVRFGINCGEVHIYEDNVYGNVVNIASRLESIGKPGSVLLTECVKEELSEEHKVHLVSLGSLTLRSIKQCREIFAVKKCGLVVPDKKAYNRYEVNHKLNGISLGKVMSILISVFLKTIPNNSFFS